MRVLAVAIGICLLIPAAVIAYDYEIFARWWFRFWRMYCPPYRRRLARRIREWARANARLFR